jgi:DNA-binding MarR family transcriptional regulator
MPDTLSNRQDTVNGAGPVDVAPPPTRTPAGDAFSRFAILVFRLGGALGAAGDALAKPAGQTSARWQVLAGAESGSMTVADIARMLGLQRQSIQRVADLLEAEGLVRAVENPRHRRASLLTLTESGAAALRSIQEAQRVWADALGAKIGQAKLERASDTLEATLRALSPSRGRSD